MTDRFDVVIHGGSLIDGASALSVPYRADIGVSGDRIVAIGDLSQCKANLRYDASGLVVAPGFIDIHTHSDISLSYHPEQNSSISMGVTTQIVGNCGLSLGFAVDSDTFAFEKRWLAPHRASITWSDFEDHLLQMEQRGCGNNIVPLAGHGTLRKRIMGVDDRPADSSEMTGMKSALEAALESGCWGLSSGLEYPPSAYADEAELTELCRVVGKYAGIYATHLRNEGDTLIEAVQEAINVSEAAGVPLQLSHHKAEGSANWGKIATTLKMVEDARLRGVDVQTDQYPYTAFMTSLAIQTLPKRALAGSPDDIAARLNDPIQRQAIREEMLNANPEWDDLGEDSPWLCIQIGVCRHRPQIQGKTVAQLARNAGMNPVDYVLELLSESGYISAVNFAISEADIATVLQFPWTSIGSDGSGTDPTGISGKDQIHPRTYGTFTRVLGKYVRELRLITLSEAIHKMTGLPASRMGIPQRGVLLPGNFADITIFNPATVSDLATFDSPHVYSTGIDAVLVNGQFALKSGNLANGLNGKVLRHV